MFLLVLTSVIGQDNEQSFVFDTDGLYYAEFYDYIFRGHFENSAIKREDTAFLMIFEQYLRAYGRLCPDYLPADKTEIMEQICAVEEVTRNGYGTEIGRTCVEWKWVGTGLYARPDLYEAKMKVEGVQRAAGLQTVMKMVADQNALGNSVDMIHKAKGLKNDMAQFFSLNRCSGKGVKRFEDNLRLFALNRPGIRMQGTSKYADMKASGGPTGAQNLNKLVDDLVTDQAKTWAFNRYLRGSISGVTVRSKDGKGRPTVLKANYNYQGFGGRSAGWVQISFANGLPKCMYFFDFPQNCKTPNSSIVAAYAQGNYKKQ
ncbi:MAG: hypothetical protein AAGB24_08280 [Bacteroidota bacterium]